MRWLFECPDCPSDSERFAKQHAFRKKTSLVQDVPTRGIYRNEEFSGSCNQAKVGFRFGHEEQLTVALTGAAAVRTGMETKCFRGIQCRAVVSP